MVCKLLIHNPPDYHKYQMSAAKFLYCILEDKRSPYNIPPLNSTKVIFYFNYEIFYSAEKNNTFCQPYSVGSSSSGYPPFIEK